MRAILGRLKRLEAVSSVEQRNGPLMIEFGYVVKRLPSDYSGPRHLGHTRESPRWEASVGGAARPTADRTAKPESPDR
jgi:hypothetical protein